MTIDITRATSTDLDDVAGLFDGYRRFYEQPADIPAARDFIRQRMNGNESVILLARNNTAPAGFTQLYPIFSSVSLLRSWLLNDLFVHPDHRRHGVGRSLMNAAIDHARRTGYGRVQLETGVDNSKAKQLYESLGFTMSEGCDYYTLDVR